MDKKVIKQTHKKNKRIIEPKLGLKDDVLPQVASGTAARKKKFAGLGIFERRKLQKHGETAFLINMFFSNGTSKEFVIVTNEETFTYKKRTYYLRYEDSWFSLTQNQYILNFFDDYPVPISREVKMVGDESFFSVKPENLKSLLKMEYVKVLSQNLELDKYLKMAAIFSIINAALTVIILFMLYRMGSGG